MWEQELLKAFLVFSSTTGVPVILDYRCIVVAYLGSRFLY